jgi:large subunit ribosomal protein L22
MDVISTYKFARVSAQKARDVTREIQGLPVSAALDILTFTPRKSAFLIGKVVKTAIADAENNFELSVDSLFVKEATVGEGPTFKRFQPRARGSAGAIRKRTSHIRIVLSEMVEAKGEAEEVTEVADDEPEAADSKKAPAPKKKAPAAKKAAPRKKAAAAAK